MRTLDPTDFGYIKSEDCLLPEKACINIYPPIEELVPSCNCETCARKSCSCVRSGLSCISFCACQIEDTCKNRYKNV